MATATAAISSPSGGQVHERATFWPTLASHAPSNEPNIAGTGGRRFLYTSGAMDAFFCSDPRPADLAALFFTAELFRFRERAQKSGDSTGPMTFARPQMLPAGHPNPYNRWSSFSY
ncbi:MAG: hypothetical protein FWD50_00170 [Betaproteobacteria bacterium]|nr:hypothetical protein [Betaproteobacteria bacterium]